MYVAPKRLSTYWHKHPVLKDIIYSVNTHHSFCNDVMECAPSEEWLQNEPLITFNPICAFHIYQNVCLDYFRMTISGTPFTNMV